MTCNQSQVTGSDAPVVRWLERLMTNTLSRKEGVLFVPCMSSFDASSNRGIGGWRQNGCRMEAEWLLDKIDHQQHLSITPSVETRPLDIHAVDHFSGDGFACSRAALVGSSSCLLSLWAKNALDMRCIQGMDFDQLRMDACQSIPKHALVCW